MLDLNELNFIDFISVTGTLTVPVPMPGLKHKLSEVHCSVTHIPHLTLEF